jgi:hypothetical protein
MEVDVAGTAQGIWVEAARASEPNSADESRFVTLADDPYKAPARQVVPAGPAALGAAITSVPVQAAGRVNLRFAALPGDGRVHCYYSYDRSTPFRSYLVAQQPSGELLVQLVSHADGATPCNADPSTWQLGASAVRLVR